MRKSTRFLRVLAWVGMAFARALVPPIGRVLRPKRRAFATTGPAHGKDAEFQIDNSANALKDTSPYVRDVAFAVSGQTVDVSGMQSTADWRTFLSGLRGVTITVSGVLDDTAVVGSSVVVGLDAVRDTRSFQYGPLGTSTGEPKISGECIVESVDWNTGVEVESTFSWTLRVTGALSIGTQS